MQYPTKLLSYKTINKIRRNIIDLCLEPQFTLYDRKIYFLQRYLERLTSDGSRGINHNIENVCIPGTVNATYGRLSNVSRDTKYLAQPIPHRADLQSVRGKYITKYAQNLTETVNCANRKYRNFLVRRSYEISVTNDMPFILNAHMPASTQCTYHIA